MAVNKGHESQKNAVLECPTASKINSKENLLSLDSFFIQHISIHRYELHSLVHVFFESAISNSLLTDIYNHCKHGFMITN